MRSNTDGMNNIRKGLEPMAESITLVGGKSDETSGNLTLRSDELPDRLRKESLTSMQLLHRSGNQLMSSMETDGLVATEVVELAKALASTVQVQVNLLKAMKEFK
jgi:hypothetical protein